VAKRSSPRRGRSRKRRPAAHSAIAQAPSPQSSGGPAAGRSGLARADAPPRAAGRRRNRPRERGSGVMDLRAMGERPRPPWHPWPLSELVILAGIVGTVVGIARGASGRAVLFAGIAAVAVGTIEFTVREHLSGYKSHTTLLAFLPTALLHGALVLALSAGGASVRLAAIIPLVIDLPLFTLLFKLLRERFLHARRELRLAQRR
jgi:hypothetical protein